MRRLGRKGRVLKWAGLGLSLVILVAWLASNVWSCSYSVAVGKPDSTGSSWRVTALLGNGDWTLSWERGSWATGWCYIRTWGYLISLVSSPTGRQRQVLVPLSIPLLLVALPTALLWWRDRRRFPPGHCQHCGYDLTGNVTGVCSECGAAIPKRDC